MVTCRDILNWKLDGMELIAGEEGLDRIVSWSYIVQTRPCLLYTSFYADESESEKSDCTYEADSG